jgi:hypothetical protein
MATLPSLVVSAVTTFDGKALKKGEKQISVFEKGAKKLGVTFAAAFSAQAVINFGKNAVKAFAENEKSAKRLAVVVKNLGLAFETPLIEKNLDEISAKYGYQGEVLRESYQKLITVTGSATKAQDLLNLSLDIAAGSGQDLLTVNQDLAALYVGNTKGLKKYNLGITNAELATMKYEDAVALLGKTFKGAAGEELTTFSGKMRVLGEAADNAQEIIGTSLVDSLSLLAGEGNSVQPLADAMGDFATYIGDAIYGVAVLTEKLKGLPGAGLISKAGGARGVFDVLAPQAGQALKLLDFLSEYGKKAKGLPGMGGYPSSALGGTFVDPNEAARKKAEADAAKRRKQISADAAKAAKADKQKLALTKAAAVFDNTRISIAAALKATYDKETKLRLEALMLIEEDKGEAALKKIDELAKFQKNADMQRLAGVEEISNATLQSLNTQLLTELKVINDSKMAEGNKELAREEAFKKYNAAITAAGGLAAKESYNERVQIQLTEIARLASISKTSSAANTANLLLESSELDMISRIEKAQMDADNARYKALKDYIALLNGVGAAPSVGGVPQGSFDKNGPLGGLLAGAVAGVNPTFTPMPTLTDPFASYGFNPITGTPTQSVEITVNAGVGDPEAIARAVEDIFNQSGYRGTSVGRNTGVYAV